MSGSTSLPRYWLPAVLLMAGLIGVLVTLCSNLIRVSDISASFLFWISWVLCLIFGLAILISVAGRRDGVVKPPFLISILFLLIFVFRPIQLLIDPSYRADQLTDDFGQWSYALLLGLLGFLFLCLGYYVTDRIVRRQEMISGIRSELKDIDKAKYHPHINNHSTVYGSSIKLDLWIRHRLILVVTLYLLLGVLASVYVVRNSGGLDLFLSTMRGRFWVQQSGIGWTVGAFAQLVTAAALMMAAYQTQVKRISFLFLVCIVLSLLFSFLLGVRMQIVKLIIALIIIFYFGSNQQRQLSKYAVLVALILMPVYVVSVRYARLQGDIMGILQVGTSSSLSMLGDFLEEFNQFDWFVILISRGPQVLGFQYGLTFIEFFTRFVPRSIWPSKPLPYSMDLNVLLGGPGTGVPATIIGELYINFHVFGVVIGMLIFGFLLAYLYQWMNSQRYRSSVIVIYAFTYASLAEFFTRDFSPMLFGYLMIIGPVILGLRYATAKKSS